MKRISRRMAANNESFPAAYLGLNHGMSVETFTEALLGGAEPARSAEFATLLLREYDPDQLRDELGRWTLAGGGDAASSGNNSPTGWASVDWSNAAKAFWASLGYVVTGSEFPSALEGAPDAARIYVIARFKNRYLNALGTANERAYDQDFQRVQQHLQK